MTRRLSMRDAINAKCRDCIYDPLARGTWREQVAECSSSNCPLHPLRPVPVAATRKKREAEARTPEVVAPVVGGSLFDLPGHISDQ